MILKMTNAAGVSYTEIDHISFTKGKISVNKTTTRGDYKLEELHEFKRGEVTEPIIFELYGRWGWEKTVTWKSKKENRIRRMWRRK